MSASRDFQIVSRHPGIDVVHGHSARSFPAHMHDQYGIGLLQSGGQRSRSRRGMVEALPGNLINVVPGEVHDGHALGGEARRWTMLYLDPELVADLAADLTEGARREADLKGPVVSDQRVKTLFARAAMAASGEGGLDEALLPLLAFLSGGAKGGPPPLERLVQVRERIDDMPADAHPLEELADDAGVSKFQLLRGFAAMTGLTPHAYVLQRRLHLARRLLAAGQPPSTAAATAGFADQSHLTRIFVRTFGIAPGAYARRLLR
ncbi:AraC family transcriptional regulator [Massilia endophytica]|uniref:AraC family transcriptional regulator n=1 Tax=Massilia endophytica TaxID=2899220 RepID=UPI001E4CD0FF|nr:AraC family transcriptional regulator [Massilia endophytica]UGQ45519.1 AraC family transcriptional regulator [Massilia endophytica]